MNSFIFVFLGFFPRVPAVSQCSRHSWAPPNTQLILNLGLMKSPEPSTFYLQDKSPINLQQQPHQILSHHHHHHHSPSYQLLPELQDSLISNDRVLFSLTTNSAPSVSAPKKFPLSQVLPKPGHDYFQPELGLAHAVLAWIPGDAPVSPLQLRPRQLHHQFCSFYPQNVSTQRCSCQENPFSALCRDEFRVELRTGRAEVPIEGQSISQRERSHILARSGTDSPPAPAEN